MPTVQNPKNPQIGKWPKILISSLHIDPKASMKKADKRSRINIDRIRKNGAGVSLLYKDISEAKHYAVIILLDIMI